MKAVIENAIAARGRQPITEPPPGDFTIRALNMDNYRDALKLAELMAACFGEVPTEMASPEFWFKEQSALLDSGNLVHAVALHNGQYVAHIGLRYYDSSAAVRVCLPVVRSDYRPYCLRIMRAFWRELEYRLSRQGVKAAFFYCPMSRPFQQLVGTKCFRTQAVAVIPGSKTSENTRTSQRGGNKTPAGIVVLQYLPSVSSGERITIYPPTSHFTHIQQMYDALALKRVFSFSQHSGNSSKQCLDVARTACDQGPELRNSSVAGLRINFLHDVNLYQFTVFPSEIVNSTQAIRCIEALAQPRLAKGRLSNIHVALDDPECPSFCRALEECNYRFCGILPQRDERDYVLYARFEDDLLNQQLLYPKDAKSLRSYLIGDDYQPNTCH